MKHTSERGTLRNMDKLLLFLVLIACLTGLVLISSAVKTFGDTQIYLFKQIARDPFRAYRYADYHVYRL